MFKSHLIKVSEQNLFSDPLHFSFLLQLPHPSPLWDGVKSFFVILCLHVSVVALNVHLLIFAQ